MFKDKINVTTLKNYNAALKKLKDGEVIRVIHRGSDTKVILTEDYFFKLHSAYLNPNQSQALEELLPPDGVLEQSELV